MILTRAQRVALKKVYDRPTTQGMGYYGLDTTRKGYRAFRRMVVPMIGDAGIMVPWCGMWLGIETDGYTHS